MNWNQELLNSAVWLGKTFAITLVVFVLVMAVLARTTVWGRQFWSLSGGYFSPKRSWRPLLGVALLLLFTLFSVRMNVLFSYWYNDFYSALQALDQPKFWFSLNLFGILAAIHVVRALVASYIRSAFTIHWRQWLNDRTVSEWLGGQSYYLGRFAEPSVDNPDQRIQQDVTSLITTTLTLALGLVSAVVSMYEFTGILWNLSASMTVFGTEVPRAMVFLVYVYVIAASVFAFRIGRPLIELNFLNEKFTANYRYLLVRMREYGESIALYRGEEVERRGLLKSFSAVIGNAWDTLWRSLKLDGYNLVISQIAVIFPFIIQAPRLFAGTIKLGDVMQTSQAFGQVEDALSFFRSSYDSFAGYRAVLDRLSGFEANVKASSALALPQLKDNPDALVLRGLSVMRPDGQPLTRDLHLTLSPGQALLIRGPSGSGKTTLLRTLAGLWPFSTGQAERPGGNACLFLSQRPYLPMGSLRGALAYPGDQISDDAARQILAQVQLGHLADQLDVVQDWSQVLSPGEQQRLAFGRVLANRPSIVFLDEATSATDSGLEHGLYALLRAQLPQAMLVSVGHRETLAAFHDQALTLGRDGAWKLESV
ncbi:ABC transporter ATP-binding protein/permease [Sphaerotilus montanus]|jgi:putative ATP-binding cassette transporter|uniref:Putative ATP-binding cassette transporter n=1 Tax=Sphaerotilus montanus TaxID=522889 RepID=A0A7Y9R0W6_9BURK|nr:ABC transporter ATP-binding protein/permease [Sphaerotilus montanus]NYG34261.1 putative ATP-binding cassette transporter [Sphaerotilus montanus]NZD58188.1 ABC transporter ATP-binding protein/permease [Sphaerotilus montanus]